MKGKASDMAKVSEIYDFLDGIAPFRIQDSWDNSGLLVGQGAAKVTKVLLTLDASSKAVDEAESLGCQLVITHHPVIFSPLRSLREDDPACRLLINGISCISCHTNLDSAEFGISDMMCQALGFENTHQPIEINRIDPKTGRNVGYGTVGLCNELAAQELAELCKKVFGCVAIKYTAGKGSIKRVGMVSGAGGEFIRQAAYLGLDAFISSEVKHHQFLEAERLGITLIDAGHHETEVIAMPYLKDKLTKEFSDVKFIISTQQFCGKTV